MLNWVAPRQPRESRTRVWNETPRPGQFSFHLQFGPEGGMISLDSLLEIAYDRYGVSFSGSVPDSVLFELEREGLITRASLDSIRRELRRSARRR